MDFGNNLKPKNPFALLEQAGIKVSKGKNGMNAYYKDPNSSTEFVVQLTPELLQEFQTGLAAGLSPKTIHKSFREQQKEAMKSQEVSKPEFTETVTPLSYNEQGGVATENQPSMVKKVK
jgi:hypothetical protein